MKRSFEPLEPMLGNGDMLLAAEFLTFLSSKQIDKVIVFILWHPEFCNLRFRRHLYVVTLEDLLVYFSRNSILKHFKKEINKLMWIKLKSRWMSIYVKCFPISIVFFHE